MLDVAVIGAGHNGLVAAAYLARAGLTVECFERRDVVGGACVTEELWPGVRASPGAYTLSLLRPEIVRELDLASHGLSVTVHEPYLFAPFPDGRKVVTWSSREETCAAIERDWSAADAAAYREFADRWESAAERARPLMLEPPDRERWLEAVGEGILDGSIADELADIPSEEVRVPFAIQGLIGTLAGPDDPGHRLRRLLPRPRRGVGDAGRVGLRARRDGRRDGGAARRRRGGRRARAARGAGRARARRGRARGRAWCSQAATRSARGSSSRTRTR